jgi:hypothetical protein
LVSALTRAAHCAEVGGILGLGVAMDSATPIVESVRGDLLLGTLDPARAGLFGALGLGVG